MIVGAFFCLEFMEKFAINDFIRYLLLANTNASLLSSGPLISIDIEVCSACGGVVKIVACIEDSDDIDKILSHLEERLASEKDTQLPPSRASPQQKFF